MADSARIEELRKRYHENPRRFFAPLANEYRKSGFLDRAILLCEKHLAEQPDNMNGLVVYGQTLFESGRQNDARMPFERALEQDPENLIALRQLGDIARLAGDVPTAKGWYDKVLEFDRRNDEVLELLAEMGVGASDESASTLSSSTTVPLISVASSVSVSGGEGLDIGLVDVGAPKAPVAGPGTTKVINAQRLADADREHLEIAEAATLRIEPPATPAAPPAAPAPSRRATLLDLSFDFSEIAEIPAPAPLPAAPLMGAEAAGLETTEFASEELAPLAPPLSFSQEPSLADTLPMMESPWRENPSQEPPMEPVMEPPMEPPMEPVTQPSASSRPRMTRADLASLPLLADYGLEDDEVVRLGTPLATSAVPEPTPAMAVPEPEPRVSQKTPTFVTETMATLYLQQGFRDKARDVYRQLVAQSPNDAALQVKLAELEESVSEMPEFETPSAESFEPEPAPANALLADVSFAGVGLSTPRPSSSRTPLATPAVATGPTAREFFAAFARRGLAAAATVAAVSTAAPAAEEPAVSEAPAAAAATGWPLDALFGAATDLHDLHAAEVIAGLSTFVGPTGATGLDHLFAEPASTPSGRRTVSRASQMLNFDQFFSPTPTAPQESAAAAEPAIELASAAEPPADPGDDDLDQFHGWLQALKP